MARMGGAAVIRWGVTLEVAGWVEVTHPSRLVSSRWREGFSGQSIPDY